MTQQVRSHIGRHRLLSGRSQRILEDGIDDLTTLERTVRRAMGNEHRAAGRGAASLLQIAAERLANLCADRYAIVELPLAAHQEFARAPVDIVQLDRDDL